MSNKYLGKIVRAYFGIGGYQEAMIGLFVELSFDKCCGSMQSKCAWSPALIECSTHCKWTEADRDKQFAEIVRYVDKLLNDAKVRSVDKLAGIPIEVTSEGLGSSITEWRILTEVL